MSKFVCNALDSAVTFLPDGKIAPCCIIKNDYSKNITELYNLDRFSDLKGIEPKAECQSCVAYNKYNRQFDKFTPNGNIKFIDFRNSNLCNLKCRTCGPRYSSAWARELGLESTFVETNVDEYLSDVLTNNIEEIYFAGGEPMMNSDHWRLIESLIEMGLAPSISLQYSTNLTIIDYKDKNVFDLWKHFKKVTVLVSVDATGTAFENIRSNASWTTLDKNLTRLIENKNISVSLAFTMSILSIWFLKDVLSYALSKRIGVTVTNLTDPHYFTLNVMPDEFVKIGINLLNESIKLNPSLKHSLTQAINALQNNDDVFSFNQMISSVLLADKIRSENLFDMLPFKDYATKLLFKNQ